MKKTLHILAAASVLGAANSEGFLCGDAGVPYQLVSENEPFVRVRLYRGGDTSLVQTVDYFTVDGPAGFPARPAKAGLDYVACSGTATFGIGETTTRVDIPLTDIGVVDGLRDFTLVLTNQVPGLVDFVPVWPDSLWI